MSKQKSLSAWQGMQIILLVAMAVLIIAAINPPNAFITSDPNFQGIKLFSYFTIQSSFIAAGVFLLGAISIWRQKQLGAWYASLRGASVLYMMITGIGYAVLLEGAAKPGFDWADFTLHKLTPVFIVLWFCVWPSKNTISPRGVSVWLVFPLIWVVATMVRGGIDGWYPYGFLDPGANSGVGGVAMYILGILLAFIAIGQLVAWIGRRRAVERSLLG